MTPSIDQKLAREYEVKRAQNERDRDRRRDEVYARDPEIARLHEEIRVRFAESVRTMLADRSNTSALTDSLKLSIERLQADVNRRLCALGLPSDYLALTFACSDCQDRGFVDDFGQQPCNCYKLRRAQLLKEEAGMSGTDNQTFDYFDPSIFPTEEQRTEAQNAKRLCERFANSLEKPARPNLVLTGKSGLGKTFLLNCVADRAMQRGVPALPMTAFNMLAAMRDYHFGNTSEQCLLNQMLRCRLLLIDDLGTEPMLKNITVEYLFMLLNERMSRRLPTVVATNLAPADLLTRYGERVVSRLLDRSAGEFIKLSGRDLRFRGQ